MSTQPYSPPVTDPLVGKESYLSQQEANTPVKEIDPWSNSRAAAIAIGDFRKAEAYRTQNHDQRYRIADQLYLGWKPSQTWPNTKIPRSSLAVYLVFEQLEALMPSLIGALFPDDTSLAFGVDAEPNSTPESANAVRDLIASQLRNLGYRSFMSLREIALRHCKSFLLYGNGITEFGWLNCKSTRQVWHRPQIMQRALIQGPNGPVAVPTGKLITMPAVAEMREIQVSKPCLQPTDIRDFYWDPNCLSHDINEGSFCAVRSKPTINDLLEYDGQEGFNLPRKGGPGSEVALDVLLELARTKSQTVGDQSKVIAESYRGVNYQPTTDYSIDPSLARLDLVRYWQKNRHVWILKNYQDPIYNAPNRYGVLPFVTTPYVELPSRWAGLSLPDLCEGDQRLQESIINARVDELALLIHAPMVKKRGVALPLSQQRLRPGLMWESDDPSNDFKRVEMGNVTAQAFVEVNEANNRTQRKTGITDLAVLGTPASGGNSANRTATGVSAQGSASGKRITYQVENQEDRFCVPILNAIHAMNQRFLDPDQMVQILGDEGQYLTIDPVDVLNASVKFTMQASGRMRQRQALQSGGLAVILQSILNPALLQFLALNGIMPNVKQLEFMLTDTYNLPKRSLFTQMTPQQMQQFQQQRMAEAMLKMQMQQQRLDAQGARQEEKDETSIINTLLPNFVTPQVAHQALNHFLGTKLDTSTGKEPQPSNGQSAAQ